jgi:hypothetical protein
VRPPVIGVNQCERTPDPPLPMMIRRYPVRNVRARFQHNELTHHASVLVPQYVAVVHVPNLRVCIVIELGNNSDSAATR